MGMRASQVRGAIACRDGRDDPSRRNSRHCPLTVTPSVPSRRARRVRAVDDNEHKTQARKDLGIFDGIV